MSRHKAEKSPQQMTIECHDIFEVCHDTIRQDNFLVVTKAKAAEGELCREKINLYHDKDQAELRKLCHDIEIVCRDIESAERRNNVTTLGNYVATNFLA